MTDTIREKCLDALKTQLDGMTKGEPVADPYPVEFSQLDRGPATSRAKNKILVGGIVEGDEQVRSTASTKEKSLRVTVEFTVHIEQGKNPSTVTNEVIGAIERRVQENENLDGHAKTIREVGNSVDFDGDDEHSADGAVFFVIDYRHRHNDPRTSI